MTESGLQQMAHLSPPRQTSQVLTIDTEATGLWPPCVWWQTIMTYTSSQHDDGPMEPAVYWQALYTRDSRFDGRFFIGTVTTRGYCRPICRIPFGKPGHLVWFASAAAAEAAGFRPCQRCRPDTSPGTPAWIGTSAVVSRALRLIGEGALDDGDVDALALRVGIGSRQLRRLFVQHLGASPIKVATTRRLHFARKLIEETDLPIVKVALSSGFSSLRQFNHAIPTACGHSPTKLRRLRGRSADAQSSDVLVIRLPYRARSTGPR